MCLCGCYVYSLRAFCNLIGTTGESRKSDSCTKTVYKWNQTLLPWVEGLASQTNTSALVSHFCWPSLAYEHIFNHMTLLLTTWCCSCHLCHCVCMSLLSACTYLTGRGSQAASGARSPEGRYVHSAVLHAPEEGSWGFSTLVPICSSFHNLGM